MKNYSSEVLVYLNKVKKYFETNENASLYFLEGSDSERFFNGLCEIAEKNIEERGVPELSKEQFEELRTTSQPKQKRIEGTPFVEVLNHGIYCLN